MPTWQQVLYFRITSYNVCYTKLLRNLFIEAGLDGNVLYFKADPERDEAYRQRLKGEAYFLRAWIHFDLLRRVITSYSIHYTKLYENTDGVHPALHLSNNKHDDQRSTYSVRSSAFLRLKTLEVKYKLSKELSKKIGLFDSFEIYLNGNNLATWSNLPDEFDPEQKKLEVYPLTKRYNLGVRVSF